MLHFPSSVTLLSFSLKEEKKEVKTKVKGNHTLAVFFLSFLIQIPGINKISYKIYHTFNVTVAFWYLCVLYYLNQLGALGEIGLAFFKENHIGGYRLFRSLYCYIKVLYITLFKKSFRPSKSPLRKVATRFKLHCQHLLNFICVKYKNFVRIFFLKQQRNMWLDQLYSPISKKVGALCKF